MVNLLFSLLFLTLPLLSIPNLAGGYELPKIIGFVTICDLSLIYFLFLLIKRKIVLAENPLIPFASIYLLINFLASAFGISWATSLYGSFFRKEGLITLTHYYFFFILLSQAKNLRIKFGHLIQSLIIGGLLASLFALKQVGEGRIFGTFGEPNFLGGYLALLFPFCFYLFKTSKNKLLRVLSLLTATVFAVTIYLTYSRTALLSLGAVAAILLVKQSKLRLKWFLFASIIYLALLLVFRISAVRGVSPNENRLRIYTKAFEVFTKRPLLGYGKENFGLAFSNSLQDKDIGLKDLHIDRGHNQILDLLVEGGIIGLISYLLLVIKAFKILFMKLRKKEEPLLTATMLSLIAYLIIGQLNVFSLASNIIFWFLLGLIASRGSSEQRFSLNKRKIHK